MSRECLVSGMLLASGAGSQADPPAEPGAGSDKGTAAQLMSWSGFERQAVERGIDFTATYIGEVVANASGGIQRGAVYEGLFGLALELDLARLGLWENAKIHISSIYPHGRSPSARLTGDLLAVSNIDAWESFRLYHLWYEHNLFDQRLSIRFGQLAADEEFAGTNPGASFLNAAFGWPAFISANTVNTGPAYFAPASGLRVRVTPTETTFFQAGIFDGDSFDDLGGDPRPNESGTRFHLDAGQGLFAIAETGLNLELSEHRLPGEYKAGIWYHSGSFESIAEAASVPNAIALPEHEGNHGIYLAAEQMVWREPSQDEQGLSLFARVGYSPPDRNLFEWVADGGMTYTGFFPGREHDTLGLGIVFARISDDLRRVERRTRAQVGSPAMISDHEMVLEGTYMVYVNQYLSLQPDIQWVHHPGGSGAQSDAVVIALRGTIIF